MLTKSTPVLLFITSCLTFHSTALKIDAYLADAKALSRHIVQENMTGLNYQ